MEQDFNRFGIGRHDNHLADAAVQRLGGLVRTLLGLLVVGGLLNEVEKSDDELGICEGKCFLGHGCVGFSTSHGTQDSKM